MIGAWLGKLLGGWIGGAGESVSGSGSFEASTTVSGSGQVQSQAISGGGQAQRAYVTQIVQDKFDGYASVEVRGPRVDAVGSVTAKQEALQYEVVYQAFEPTWRTSEPEQSKPESVAARAEFSGVASAEFGSAFSGSGRLEYSGTASNVVSINVQGKATYDRDEEDVLLLLIAAKIAA